jgi:hypothetical protein
MLMKAELMLRLLMSLETFVFCDVWITGIELTKSAGFCVGVFVFGLEM